MTPPTTTMMMLRDGSFIWPDRVHGIFVTCSPHDEDDETSAPDWSVLIRFGSEEHEMHFLSATDETDARAVAKDVARQVETALSQAFTKMH